MQKFTKTQIGLFYLFLILLCSYGGYYYKKDDGAAIGMVVGAVISAVLWFQVGKYNVK